MGFLTRTRAWWTGADLGERHGGVSAPGGARIDVDGIRTRAYGQLNPSFEVNRPIWPKGTPATYVRDGYNASPTVYAATTLRANAISSATMRVYREERGQKREVEDHPLRRLMLRPNPMTSEAEFLAMTSLYMDIAGFALIEIVRSRRKVPLELWHLRPDWAKPIMRDNGPPDWEYRIPGRDPVTFKSNDVISLTASPDLAGGATGLSPIQVATRELAVENAATDFLKLFLDHGGMPRIALVTDKAITDQAQADLLKERWQQAYGGFRNWVNVALLHSGLDVREIGMNLQEMAYPQLRELTETHICMVFGVPPILIGSKVGLDSSTYSNFELAMRAFYTNTIVPIWARLDGAFSRELLPEFGGTENLSLEFDTSKIAALQEDVTPHWGRTLSALGSGAMKLNEARIALGLPPLGREGDVLYVPGSVKPTKPELLGAPEGAAPGAPGAPPSLPGVPAGEPVRGAADAETGEASALPLPATANDPGGDLVGSAADGPDGREQRGDAVSQLAKRIKYAASRVAATGPVTAYGVLHEIDWTVEGAPLAEVLAAAALREQVVIGLLEQEQALRAEMRALTPGEVRRVVDRAVTTVRRLRASIAGEGSR